MSTAADRSKPAAQATPDSLVPIALVTLRPLVRLGIDLYLRQDPDSPPLLYRANDYEFASEDIDRLRASGVRSLYIESSALPRYQKYLLANLDALMREGRAEPVGRFQILQDSAGALLSDAFRTIKIDRTLEVVGQVGGHIVELLTNTEMVPSQLFEVMRHDYYTYVHVVNVATYAVMLACDMGVSQPEELEKITVGALLHDIGKRHLASSLVRKRGVLSGPEREIMRRHPQTGFVELRRESNLDWGQLMMVYQHHEQVDGGGYPVGVPQDEIHWQARLCSVVDVFDAMSCCRPYRAQMSVPSVLDHLHAHAGVMFDSEMTRCWISAFRRRR
jgi:putative nucleotidyltransferase with HDIG domain